MQGSAEQDGAALKFLRRLGSSHYFATALFPFLQTTVRHSTLNVKRQRRGRCLDLFELLSGTR
jgi:hypothetical protein